jgi:hypothetical protein
MDAWGLAALGGLAAATMMVSQYDALLYRGGFPAIDLLTAIVIAAAVHPGGRRLRWVLGQGPLVWIGLRSYSIYLWHWPVFMLLRPHQDIQLAAVPLLVLRLAATLILAELSYRFVETPVRRGLLSREWAKLRSAFPRPGWRLTTRYAGATLAASALLIPLGASVIKAEPPPPPSYLSVQRVQTGIWAPATPEREISHRIVRPSPVPPGPQETAQTPGPTQSDPLATTPAAETAAAPLPAFVQVSAGRVVAIGDSVMLGAVNALCAAIEGISVDAAVSRQVSTGIQMLQAWRDAGVLGDVVIVHLGTNGWFSASQFDQMMQVLANVRLVVFVNLRVPRDWESSNNAVIASGVSRYSNTALADWHAVSAGRPDLFWDDGIHLRPEGARLYASLIASVLAAHPAPTPEPTPMPTTEPTPQPAPSASPTVTPVPGATTTPAPTPTPAPALTPSPSPPSVTPSPPAPTLAPTPSPSGTPAGSAQR